jgi:hypothetical protein
MFVERIQNVKQVFYFYCQILYNIYKNDWKTKWSISIILKTCLYVTLLSLGESEMNISCMLGFWFSAEPLVSSHIYLYIIYLLRQIISEFLHYFPKSCLLCLYVKLGESEMNISCMLGFW